MKAYPVNCFHRIIYVTSLSIFLTAAAGYSSTTSRQEISESDGTTEWASGIFFNDLNHNYLLGFSPFI